MTDAATRDAPLPPQAGSWREGKNRRDGESWRNWGRAKLDAAYNNSVAVADSAAWLAQWTARSATLRARQPELLDLPYGSAPRNRIDIFRSGQDNAPLFVFIHGGYWQRNSKEMFSCMAEGLLAHGVDVALPGYTLAPQASLTHIVGEIRAAIRWLRDQGPARGVARNQLMASGWSAGGHLAACCLDMAEVDAVLAISGIHDLAPIAASYLDDALRLSADEIVGCSPLHRPAAARAAPLALAWGLHELPELQRQSRALAEASAAAGRPCRAAPVAGANHFTILQELARPDGALTALARDMLRASRLPAQPWTKVPETWTAFS